MKSSELNKELLNYFIDHLYSNSKKSQATILNIKRNLSGFIDFLEEKEINSNEILCYIEILESRLQKNSFESKLSSIRQFINWLNPVDNPFRNRVFKSNSKITHKIYSEDEILEKLTLDHYDFPSMLVLMVYELTLKLSELINLKISQYNQASKVFSINEDEIKISENLELFINHYLKIHRPSISGEKILGLDDPFLIDENSKKFTENKLRLIFSFINLKPSEIIKSKINENTETNKPSEYRLLKAYQDFHPRAKHTVV